MISVLVNQPSVLVRQRRDPLRPWNRATQQWHQPWIARSVLVIKELTANLSSKHLGQKGRNGIAEHLLDVGSAAVEAKIIREGLESA